MIDVAGKLDEIENRIMSGLKDFQRANALDVDGVAGPMTQTHLYENPNIIALTEPTSVPTATPTPTLPPLESLGN